MHDTNTHRSLSTGLKIGFALILLLLIGVTAIGLSRMALINQRMDQVVNENNLKTKLAHEMKDAVRDRAIMTGAEWLRDSPFGLKSWKDSSSPDNSLPQKKVAPST